MRFSRTSSLVCVLLAAACATGVDLGPESVDPLLIEAGAPGNETRANGQVGSTGGSSSNDSGAGGASSRVAAGGASPGMGGAGGGTTTAGISGASGGIPPTDAAATDGAVAIDSATGCVSTQKPCGGRCVLPSASLGCSLTGCDPCAIGPPHGFAKCTGDQCDFDCLSGYQRSGPSCVVNEGGAGGSAGSGGSSGSGGSADDAGPGSCTPSQCSGCIPVIQAPCCKSDQTCGCQYPFAACK